MDCTDVVPALTKFVPDGVPVGDVREADESTAGNDLTAHAIPRVNDEPHHNESVRRVMEMVSTLGEDLISCETHRNTKRLVIDRAEFEGFADRLGESISHERTKISRQEIDAVRDFVKIFMSLDLSRGLRNLESAQQSDPSLDISSLSNPYKTISKNNLQTFYLCAYKHKSLLIISQSASYVFT